VFLQFVARTVSPLCKAPPAVPALEWPLADVNAQVFEHLTRLLRFELAKAALKHLVASKCLRIDHLRGPAQAAQHLDF